VEGIRIVGEAVETGAEIETLVVAPDLLTSDYARELVTRAGAPTLEVSAHVFESLSSRDGPKGLGAVVRQRWSRLDEVEPCRGLCWVVLDAVQDPGNLGTILRTADAVGAAGVILTGSSTDPHDPVALRAGMGAIFSQPIVRAGFDEVVSWAKGHGATLAGTSDAAAADYQSVTYPHPLVLVMGSEREGLSVEQQSTCDLTVRIPMAGRSDSLNLSVAAGVVLYEIFNQRRREDGRRICPD